VQVYDRGARHNLYAFVEAGPDVSENSLRDFVTRRLADVAPPAHVHVSEALPRAASGGIRTEILQLVASNQLDEIDSLLTNDAERETVAGLVAQRRNLHDRF
jgi:acyl-coenzyme A synthetase/AMP-(fatty) acid ligase